MKTNVAVFFGGRSVEHEISVISALQAINAFNKDKYEIIPIYISKQGRWYTGPQLLDIRNYRDMNALTAASEEVYMRPEYGDYNVYKANPGGGLFGKKNPVVATLHAAIPVLHGTHGEDGIFEGVLETIGIPFAGCDTLSSANGMDKITMKMILKSEGIPVVDYVWFTDYQWQQDHEAWLDKVEKELGYPVIVKPANLGSSVGISKASDRAALTEAIDNATKFAERIIVEHMVEQLKEINCSVLGDADEHQSSVCEEPIKSGDFLSYEDKYGRDLPRAELPRREPRGRDDRREGRLHLRERDQHHTRFAELLSVGGQRHQLRAADGPSGAAGAEAQAPAGPQDIHLRQQYLRPGRRREGRQRCQGSQTLTRLI